MIEITNLSKTFKYHEKSEGLKGSFQAIFKRKKKIREAVRNISFSIKKGEFVGFVGPNGAGKTTTLKMLSGILTPSAGTMQVAGHNPTDREDDYKRRIAIVMGQKAQLWQVLPPLESFRLMQKIYEIPEDDYQKRLEEMTELMDVKDIIKIQTRKLSLGQRMKCELISSLLHHPEVLFLDEPTIGLDVVAAERIRKFLKEYNEKNNTTIILTSHYMDDVQDLCKRLIIINEGKIGYDGSLEDMIDSYNNEKFIKLTFTEDVTKKDLARYGKVLSFSPQEGQISITNTNTRQQIASLVAKLPIKDISINDITLEEIIKSIFTKQ